MVQAILNEVVKISRDVIGNAYIPSKYRNMLLDIAAGSIALPEEAVKEETTVAHMPALRLAGPVSDDSRVLYYLHGGGYQLCSPKTHQSLVYQMIKDCSAHALVVDYRMAPEHPYPAAVHDALDGYRWLLRNGFEAEDIIFGGDSAGGGLAVATMLSLKKEGLPQPAAAVLLSPWTDLEGTGESMINAAGNDIMISADKLRHWARDYLQGAHPRNPLASPIHGDLKGLPPLKIEVGENEIIRDDSVRLHQKAMAAGVDADIKVWPGMMHVFQAFHRFIPEAKESLKEISEFLGDKFSGRAATTGTL